MTEQQMVNEVLAKIAHNVAYNPQVVALANAYNALQRKIEAMAKEIVKHGDVACQSCKHNNEWSDLCCDPIESCEHYEIDTGAVNPPLRCPVCGYTSNENN